MRWLALLFSVTIFAQDYRPLKDVFHKDYVDFQLALPSSSEYVIEKIDFAQCPSFYIFGEEKKVQHLKKTMGEVPADPKDSFIAFFPHELDDKTSKNISQLIDVIGIQLQTLGGDMVREKKMCGKYPIHLFTLKNTDGDQTYLSHIAMVDFSPEKFCLQMNFSHLEKEKEPLEEVWKNLIEMSK